MDRFESMRIFVAVAESQGFAAAARQLRLSGPMVTRAVAALEAHLGARLLHRTTRQVRVTETGQRYLLDCKRILAEMDEADALAGGAHVVPKGHLIVTAPVLFGRIHIAPLLMSFLQAHPQVTARAFFVDRVVNLMEEGVDVALRIAHLPDSSLTAVRVGAVRRVIVASPDYLARRGEPMSPADLAEHEALGSSTTGGPASPWLLAAQPGQGDKLVQGPQPRIQLTLNGVEVGIMAAKAGHGLARVLSYQVRDEVAAGHLRIVLQAYEPTPIPVYLVYSEGRSAAAKVLAFVDFAAQQLRAHPALNPQAG
ncbi:MAG: LysR family transcriptional regulator [Aquabacterium sp.]|uniref:LysR family transcriptional regulator n=1 Tax=Aquabacterium sp. TaxID=1872578 RepID=UPI0025B84418|nr:LysR family transcriptional regulator [Aquabacterium sp.]MBI3381902.1 LysR family transcriptional regulator [Aquabacterium sp.]